MDSMRSLPWRPKPVESRSTRPSCASALRQMLSQNDSEHKTKPAPVTFSPLLYIPAESLEVELHTISSTLFPTLPAEIRIQIWSHAISSLPPRIIPLREVTGYRQTPAYFVTSRPHPLFASICREAREAVFETLQPLLVPGKDHDIVSVNFEKDTILLCSDNGTLRPKTLKRLSKAMTVRREGEALHLAAEIQIEWRPQRHCLVQRFDMSDVSPRYGVLASTTELSPSIKDFTLVPMASVKYEGAESHKGELCFGSAETFGGMLREYYEYSEGAYEYERRKHMVPNEKRGQWLRGPQAPEVKWASLQIVGGKKFRDWRGASGKVFWRLKKGEGEDEILRPICY